MQRIDTAQNHVKRLFWTERSDSLHWSGGLWAKHLPPGGLFLSWVHLILKDEVKRALPSGASCIRWSPAYCLDRRPPPRSTSLCCGKTDTARSNGCIILLIDGFVVVSAEADKQAQESVTLCCITRNAAEPHDWCRGAGGTVRSFWEEMHVSGIYFYPIGAVVIFI